MIQLDDTLALIAYLVLGCFAAFVERVYHEAEELKACGGDEGELMPVGPFEAGLLVALVIAWPLMLGGALLRKLMLAVGRGLGVIVRDCARESYRQHMRARQWCVVLVDNYGREGQAPRYDEGVVREALTEAEAIANARHRITTDPARGEGPHYWRAQHRDTPLQVFKP